MNKQMGLLVMRDENDILEEYLNRITEFYDVIYVLDGSDGEEGRHICAKFDEVAFYGRDNEMVKGPHNDSIRKYIWDIARKEVKDKQWVGILHPDEFPIGSPLEMLDQYDTNPDIQAIAIRNLHFFLHTSQKENWNFKQGDLIEPLMKYYMAPGWAEWRYFRFDKNLQYRDDHRWVVPPDTTNHGIHVDFVHKQFTYRSTDQGLKRAKTRWESGWQPDEYCLALESEDVFFDTLRYPESFAEKYPEQYEKCWYNSPEAYVAKLED